MSIHALDTKVTAQAVEDIAAQFSRPLSEVQEILQSQLSALDRHARIKQYVPLLAIKQVKDLFRGPHTEHSEDINKTKIAAA